MRVSGRSASPDTPFARLVAALLTYAFSPGLRPCRGAPPFGGSPLCGLRLLGLSGSVWVGGGVAGSPLCGGWGCVVRSETEELPKPLHEGLIRTWRLEHARIDRRVHLQVGWVLPGEPRVQFGLRVVHLLGRGA